MRHFGLLVVLLVVLTGAAASGFEARPATNPAVEEQSGDIVLTWTMRVEAGVRHYRIERRAANATEFVRIGEVSAHGAGYRYEYRDDGVFKSNSNVVTYQVLAVSSEGSEIQLVGEEVGINYSATAVRRTWGSIKAMFQ